MQEFHGTNSTPRNVQYITVEIDRQDGYLCRTYELLSPATLREYKTVFDDLEERFQNGERSVNERLVGGLLVIDESTVERYVQQYSQYKADDLPGIYERTTANFWNENEGEDELDRLDRLHRIEAMKRLISQFKE